MGEQFVVAVSSDHAAFDLKQAIVAHLRTKLGDARVLDMGPADASRCDYPDQAGKVARAIQQGQARYGVLCCGTGIGISIAANKYKGIRAALCHDVTTARLCRQHNDAQILCLGARVTGETVALEALDVFLETPFEGGRHAGRVAKIHAAEGL